MKEIKDFSYNIFKNVSKEQFIEDVNTKPLKYHYDYKSNNRHPATSFDSLLNNYLDESIVNFTDITFYSIEVHYLFFYISFEVIKDRNRIIDIENYEEEIEVFNSFNPIMIFEGKIYITVKNLNEYLEFRGKEGIFLSSYTGHFGKCHRANFTAFLNMIKKEEKGKISDKIAKELNKVKQDIDSKLDECFKDFKDFNGIYDDVKFNILIPKYYTYCNERRLTHKHLIKNDFFDVFIFTDNEIGYYERRFLNNNDEKLKDMIENYNNCLESFSEYIGYEMEIIDTPNIFSRRQIKFKKMEVAA